MNKKPTVKKITKKKTSASSEKKSEEKKIIIGPTSLDNKLLHVKINTDLQDQDDIDELHEKIEKRLEKKLKDSGVKNCIVFVSGPNIELNSL